MEKLTKKFTDGWRVVIRCSNCETAIWSRSSGQYVSCKCCNLSITETEKFAQIEGAHKGMKMIGIINMSSGKLEIVND